MKKVINSSLRYLAVATLAGAVALSSIGTALADDAKAQAKAGVFGSVSAKTADSLTVQTKQGQSVKLAVNADTQFRAKQKADANLDDLAVGSRVAILASGDADAMSALKVMVVPGEPQVEHRSFTVIEVAGKVVTATDAQGNTVTVDLDHELSGDVKGQLITFIGAKSADINRFKANAEVKIAQVVERLEAQAKKLEAEASAETNASVKAERAKAAADVQARLETNMRLHIERFELVIERAPEQAKPSLKAALEVNVQGYQSALKTLGNSEADAALKLKVGGLRVGLGQGPTEVRADAKVKAEAEVHGKIKSVDTVGHVVVVELRDGSLKKLALSNSTEIRINGKLSSEADLKEAMELEGRYLVESSTALRINIGAGSSTSVNTGAQSNTSANAGAQGQANAQAQGQAGGNGVNAGGSVNVGVRIP